MSLSTVIVDTWQCGDEVLRVELRSNDRAAIVAVRSMQPHEEDDVFLFPNVGAAERWYARYARRLGRSGATRVERRIVDAYAGTDDARPGHGPFGGRRRVPPRDVAGRDAYRLLNVRPGVSEEALRSAYRNLALQWHPDRTDDPEASERMGEINGAYELVRRLERMAPSQAPLAKGRRGD